VVIRLTPQFTNFTSKKGAYRKAQELKARDKALLEELLQTAKDLEEALPVSLSLEAHLAEVERIIEQMKREQEAFDG